LLCSSAHLCLRIEKQIPTMSRFEEVDSIDQVIQSEQSLSVSNGHPRASDSNLSINRTAPLPPLSPSNRNHRKFQSSSQAVHRGGSPTRRIDTVGSRNASVRQSEEGSTSSRTGTGTTLNGSGLGGNMADFFSSEVFNIVIHNPTTAHRFLRFCQSRACGENMEFLQKVGSRSYSPRYGIFVLMAKYLENRSTSIIVSLTSSLRPWEQSIPPIPPRMHHAKSTFLILTLSVYPAISSRPRN